MSLSCVEVVRAALGEPIARRGGELLYHCPRHDDKHPSLSISAAKDVWMCGPCNATGKAWALAAFLSEISPTDRSGVAAWLKAHNLYSKIDGRRGIKATYDYVDENGILQFQVLRYDPKSFAQRRPDAVKKWVWNLDGVRRILYRLPEVIAAENVLCCEGEKDVESVRKILSDQGLLGIWAATCNSGGAGKWIPEFSKCFPGKRVFSVCDDDAAGLNHGLQVASNLIGSAREIRFVEKLPAVGTAKPKDLTEFFECGGSWEELRLALEGAPLATAEMVAIWQSASTRFKTRPRSQDSSKSQDEKKKSEQIDRLTLPDRREAEIVRIDGRTVFAIFEVGKAEVELVDRIETQDKIFVPHDGSFVRDAIVLPPLPDFSLGEDRGLFDDLCSFVCRYWVGPANWIRVAALYVFLSWIVHTIDEIVYLRVLGEWGSAKSRLCDVMQGILYRAVRSTGNITVGVLPRILTVFRDASLVIDEADIAGEEYQELRQILRAGSARRTPILKCASGGRNGNWEVAAFAVFGPKFLAGRKATKDDALETRFITESITKARTLGNVPVNLPIEFEEEAAALRARLMAFRIQNYGCAAEFRDAIAESAKELVTAGFDFRTAQLGAPLLALAGMVDNKDAQASCWGILNHHDIGVRLERGQGLDGLLQGYVDFLREEQVTQLEMGAFHRGLQKFAAEHADWELDLIPRKQSLSRRINLLAHVLRIQLKERSSGHRDRIVLILPLRGLESVEKPALIASAPLTSTESDTGAQEQDARQENS